MPELPDVTVYVEALERRLVGHPLQRVTLRSPFVLRTVEPPVRAGEGRVVAGVRRLGKRIVVRFEPELYFVIHLMRLGRFRWADPGKNAKNAAGKVLLATFEFGSGTLHLVEMGPKKRAALHVFARESDTLALDAGGIDVLSSDAATFSNTMRARNHTLKRALCDPRILSGIGNAYSDEILWEARLSPVQLTQKISDEELARLHGAVQRSLHHWIARLREECGSGFPEQVTAFREDMAVHGRYQKPCPRCGSPVQRIVYADRETNYCAPCQTQGRPLADRALSRLLGKDWPKTMEELEELRGGPK